MAENSKIEWTHHTFNPWRGCTKVSEGCKHCYAETMSGRNPKTLGIWGPRGTRVVAAEAYWKQPIKWNKEAEQAGERRRVFCASLADVFESEDTMPADSVEAIDTARIRLFRLIQATPHLDWLLLTKRPQNVVWDSRMPKEWWLGFPDNVWIGTSVENQARADERIPELLKVPAKVRFLSCEPLLGPVDIDSAMYPEPRQGPSCFGFTDGFGHEVGIHWVIAGGESGHGARPMHPDWARSLRDQCQAAGVAFHFKQHGEYLHTSQLNDMGNAILAMNERVPHHIEGGDQWWKLGKKAANRLLDGRTWDGFPQ